MPPDPDRDASSPIKRLPRKSSSGGRAALGLFFLLAFLYQIFVLTRFRPLYTVLEVLFFLDLAVFLRWAAAQIRRDRLLLFIILAVLVVRVPFLIQPSGLMSGSDNALEAIQSLQIREAHTAPPFLLSTLTQHGIFRHLLIAFLWDVFGSGYLTLVLFQVFLYILFLALLYVLGRRFFDRRAVAVLLLAHFAFVEVLFDFSLFLRAGTYLEMLTISLFGMAIADPEWRDGRRGFLALFFLVFAASINPFAVFPGLAFLAASVFDLARRRGWLRRLASPAAGAAAGALLLVGRRLFLPPPPDTGAWFQLQILPLSRLQPSLWGDLLGTWWRNARDAFGNILGYEFHYAHDVSPQFSFRPESEGLRAALGTIQAVLVVLAAAVLAAAVILVLLRLIRSLRPAAERRPWIERLFLFLGGAFLGRVLLLQPRPFLEPRHNMDLALWLILASFILLDALFKARPPSRAASAAIVVFLFLLAIPQAFYYHKSACFKALSYKHILSILEARGVQALATDFTFAHGLYFLSGGGIRATDSLGPVTIRFFLPELTRPVDALPPDRKAYLLYTPLYPQTAIMRLGGPRIRERLLRELRSRAIPFRIYNLKYYELVIPRAARGGNGS